VVSRFATRRLIDASASLDSADRALLNIWINRGLDDAAMARMTGLSEETIAERRDRVVAHLSDELGLPPEHVRSALTEIAVLPDSPPDVPDSLPILPDRPADVPDSPADAPDSPADGHSAPPVVADPDRAPAPTPTAAEADAAPPPRRRRRGAWSALAVGGVIVAVVLVIALESGGSGQRPAAAHSRTRPSAQTVPSTPTTTGAPSAQSSAEPLAALPGGASQGATGTVLLDRSSSNLRLNLRVSNLPPAVHGHYEIFLYDTLVSSEPLGRLRTGVTQLSVPLPGDARRYPWIDISLQPPGAVFDSGDSILRATNPLFVEAR
jgi:hypothetical protein